MAMGWMGSIPGNDRVIIFTLRMKLWPSHFSIELVKDGLFTESKISEPEALHSIPPRLEMKNTRSFILIPHALS
jgi:hypothetical protein